MLFASRLKILQLWLCIRLYLYLAKARVGYIITIIPEDCLSHKTFNNNCTTGSLICWILHITQTKGGGVLKSSWMSLVIFWEVDNTEDISEACHIDFSFCTLHLTKRYLVQVYNKLSNQLPFCHVFKSILHADFYRGYLPTMISIRHRVRQVHF